MSIIENLKEEKEPIKKGVPICFTESDRKRWYTLQKRLNDYRAVNPSDKLLKLTDYGRISLKKVMDEIEEYLNQKETA